MKELQRKQKLRKWTYSIPALVLMLGLALVISRATLGVVAKQAESAGHVEKLEATAAALSQRSQELHGNINRLETEEGVREELKEKFGVSEEGEMMAVIVDDVTESEAVSEEKDAWYSSLIKGLKSLR